MGKRQRKQSKRRRAGNSGPPLQRTNRAAASEPAPVVRMAVAARLPKACGGQVVRSGPPMVRPMIRGGYDAAQTTDDNRRHWANADSLSAAAANSLDVRKRVRERARYEVANNCYLNGMVQTLANDCIGTGPRLQMLTDDAALNDRIEERFSDWAREIHLAAKLRTMRYAKAVDGEVFAVLTTNKMLTSPIKLDLQLVECDRVTSPWLAMASNDVDGIRFDAFGNPISYCIFRSHPGDLTGDLTFDWQSAEYVIHWFKSTRPGQQRGISEIMPALPLSAILRRYTIAVLEAASASCPTKRTPLRAGNMPAGGRASRLHTSSSANASVPPALRMPAAPVVDPAMSGGLWPSVPPISQGGGRWRRSLLPQKHGLRLAK